MRVLVSLLFAVVMGIVACSPQVSDNVDAEIAVLLKGMSNPYWQTLKAGVEEAAAERGITVYLQGAQSDSPEEQLNLCETMLLRQPKALIFGAVNNVNLTPCLQQAEKQEIILVDVDGSTGLKEAQEMGITLRMSIASDNTALGRKAAEYLAGTTGKVLILEGMPGSVPGIQRKEGFLATKSDSLEVVASVSGNWDRLKAADITTDTLTRYPDLAAVFAANDMMALGAAETLHAANKPDVKVIGIDGVADAITAVKSDKLTATIAQLPYLMGREAVLKTHDLITGAADYDFDQKVPIVALDKAVLEAETEPLLEYVK